MTALNNTDEEQTSTVVLNGLDSNGVISTILTTVLYNLHSHDEPDEPVEPTIGATFNLKIVSPYLNANSLVNMFGTNEVVADNLSDALAPFFQGYVGGTVQGYWQGSSPVPFYPITPIPVTPIPLQ